MNKKFTIVICILGLFIGVFIGSSVGSQGKVSSNKHEEVVEKYNSSVETLKSKEQELVKMEELKSELEKALSEENQ